MVCCERQEALSALQEVFAEARGLRGLMGLGTLTRAAEAIERLLEEVDALASAVEIEAVTEWLAACLEYEDLLHRVSALEGQLAAARSLTRRLRSVAAVDEALEWALMELAEEQEATLPGAVVGPGAEESTR